MRRLNMVLRKNRHLQQHRNLSLRRAGIAMIVAGALVFLLATVSGIAYSLGCAGPPDYSRRAILGTLRKAR